MNRLEEGVRRLAEILDGARLPYMLIGGAAAGLWGNPRLTLDADVTAWVEESGFDDAVKTLLLHVTPRSANPVSFAHETRVLPVSLPNGLPADITFGQLPFEEAAIHRAAVMDVAGYPVKVCTVADLILHKVVSERTRDRDDIRFLVGRFRDTLDRKTLTSEVSALSELLAKPDLLIQFLACWD